jgi:hypothetical protein
MTCTSGTPTLPWASLRPYHYPVHFAAPLRSAAPAIVPTPLVNEIDEGQEFDEDLHPESQ